jgi:ribosomal protein L27
LPIIDYTISILSGEKVGEGKKNTLFSRKMGALKYGILEFVDS